MVLVAVLPELLSFYNIPFIKSYKLLISPISSIAFIILVIVGMIKHSDNVIFKICFYSGIVIAFFNIISKVLEFLA